MTTRNRKKKLTAIILLLVLCASMIAFAPGCCKKDDKYKETEYFVYHVGDRGGISIDLLTEKGKQLENLVIPEEIEGKKVTSVRGHETTPNLKKIIVSFNVRTINSWGLSPGSLFVNGYPQGLKIIYVNCEYKKCVVMDGGYLATYAEESYRKHLNSLWAFKFANMQYLYNFEDAQNKGVFFVDDLDIGEELEIIPEIPKRDGFTFTGWYAEQECINKVELNGYVKTDEEIVYLYAGWEEGS